MGLEEKVNILSGVNYKLSKSILLMVCVVISALFKFKLFYAHLKNSNSVQKILVPVNNVNKMFKGKKSEDPPFVYVYPNCLCN